MMGHSLLLLIAAALASVGDCYCPKQNHTDKVKFTKKLGFVDYVRVSHAIAVLCCAEGYENISWYRKENDIWVSFPPSSHWDDNTPTLEEDGQILRIYDAELTDQTSYRCDVKGKRKIIQHITDLKVIECDPLARGPIPTSPFPENHTINYYGGNITLYCTGYFGCSDSGQGSDQLVLWEVNGKPAREVSPRYLEQTSNNSEQTMKQATLTITPVQEEDVERTFFCVLATPQEKDGQTRIKVRIFKKDKPNVPMIVFLSIGGVLIIVSLVATLRYLYGPQIWLTVSSKISILGPKTIDNKNYCYNLFIYHADEDETKAQHIKDTLENHGLRVYITADMKGNQSIMRTFFEKTAKSAMVVFLYSGNLRNDDLANCFLQSFITERKGKDILIIEVTDNKPEEIMDWAQRAKDRSLGPKELENGRSIEDNENENAKLIEENDGTDEVANEDNNNEADTQKKVAIADDLKFWKCLPRIKVPADDRNKRKMDNFWCSLRNKIPKFAEQKQKCEAILRNRRRLSSSRIPLLAGNK